MYILPRTSILENLQTWDCILYRCTVHSVVYLITHTSKCTCICYVRILKFVLKHFKLYFLMLTLVLWQHVMFLCVSRTLFSVRWLWMCVICCMVHHTPYSIRHTSIAISHWTAYDAHTNTRLAATAPKLM